MARESNQKESGEAKGRKERRKRKSRVTDLSMVWREVHHQVIAMGQKIRDKMQPIQRAELSETAGGLGEE